MAKWTKLTDERAERLISLLAAGHHRVTACGAVGIVDKTLRRWLAAGDEGQEPWVAFAARVRAAEANCETVAVESIQAHGADDWRATAWWLERRFPLRWGETRGAQARLDAEREAMLDAFVKCLEKRGMSDVAEEVLREFADDGAEAPTGARGAAGTAH